MEVHLAFQLFDRHPSQIITHKTNVTKHDLKPKLVGGNQLSTYKYCWGVRMGLKPRITGLQVWHTDHSTTVKRYSYLTTSSWHFSMKGECNLTSYNFFSRMWLRRRSYPLGEDKLDRDPPLVRSPSVDREGDDKSDRGDRGRSLSRWLSRLCSPGIVSRCFMSIIISLARNKSIRFVML